MNGHRHGQLQRLYILVASNGFTVCCDGTPKAMQAAIVHHRLPHPLTVHDWTLTSTPTPHGGWRKVGVSTWP